jgi:hypothetical protein
LGAERGRHKIQLIPGGGGWVATFLAHKLLI